MSSAGTKFPAAFLHIMAASMVLLLLDVSNCIVNGFTNTNSIRSMLIQTPSIRSNTLKESNGIYSREVDFIRQSLENKTLVSVETCIEIHNYLQHGIEKCCNKVIFIDASWWHKGDLDGRKMYV